MNIHMINTTLIFDGNYIFYRTLHSAKGYGAKSIRFLDTIEDQNIFIRKVASDFISTINQFKGFNRIVFTKDSKSWRSQYIKDYNDTSDSIIKEYKSDRKLAKSQDDVNWDIFFKSMNRFCKIIEDAGIIVTSIDGAEGDDLIYLWSLYLNANNENAIIITADADLTQTISMNDDVFTIAYNNKSAVRKIIAPVRFYEWINERKYKIKPKGLFDSKAIMEQTFINDGANIIAKLLDEINYEEINPAEVALRKVLCGDDSDTIPSIWEWGNIKPNGKYEKRITNKDFIKVKDYLLKNEECIDLEKISTNNELQNKIRITLENSGKTKIAFDKFKENLNRNFHLIVLNKKYIPIEIQIAFAKHIENLDMHKQVFSFDRISLLKGTEYAKDIQIHIVSDAY